MSNKVEKMSVAQIPVTNSGADAPVDELIFENGFLGTVREFDELTADQSFGIPAGNPGLIDISPDRILSTKQIKSAQTFTNQTICFFDTSTREITDSNDTDCVVCGYIVEVISNSALKIKLLPQNGQLVPTV